MGYEPKAGHYLHASCSDADVYEVLGSGVDENGAATIDVRVIDLDEILHFDCRSNDPKERLEDRRDNGKHGKWFYPLTRAELPEGVSVVLRGLQWRQTTPGYKDAVRVNVNAPEGGCYGCCYLFSVHSAPGGRSPVVEGGP